MLGTGLLGLFTLSRYLSKTALNELKPKERKARIRAGIKTMLKLAIRERPDARIIPQTRPIITTRESSRLRRSGKATICCLIFFI